MSIFNKNDKLQKWRYSIKQVSVLLSDMTIVHNCIPGREGGKPA